MIQVHEDTRHSHLMRLRAEAGQQRLGPDQLSLLAGRGGSGV